MHSWLQRRVFGALFALCLPAAVVLILPPLGQLANTPDSISYLTVAHQIASGHGLTMPDFALFGQAGQGFTTWPPLFPLLLASGVSPQWVQAAGFGALGLVTFLIFAVTLRASAAVSLMVSLACTLSMPLLVDATSVWSEVTALCMTALMLWALAGLTAVNANRRWIAAVLACGLAIYSRYAMFLLVGGMPIALLLASQLPLRRRVLLAALTPFATGLLFLPLVAHNMLSSQHVSGASRAVSTRGPLANLGDAVLNTASAYAVAPPWNAVFVFAWIGVLTTGVFALLNVWRSRGEAASSASGDRSGWLTLSAAALALVYGVGMVLLRSLVQFDRLDTRLMSPAVYLLDVACCAAGVYFWRAKKHRAWERAVLAAPFVVLMALSVQRAAVQGNMAWHAWRDSGSPGWPMNSLMLYTNIQPLQVRPLNGVVLCDRPVIVRFLTGWDVRGLPSGPWSDAELRRIAAAAQALLINSADSAALAERLRAVVPHATMRALAGAQLLEWSASGSLAPIASP